MKTADQILASHLLKRRDSGGKHIPIGKRQKLGYCLMGALFIFAIVLKYVDSDNSAAPFIMGFVIAAFLRDFAWYRALRRSWPFNERIVDWDKVRQMAEPADGHIEKSDD